MTFGCHTTNPRSRHGDDEDDDEDDEDDDDNDDDDDVDADDNDDDNNDYDDDDDDDEDAITPDEHAGHPPVIRPLLDKKLKSMIHCIFVAVVFTRIPMLPPNEQGAMRHLHTKDEPRCPEGERPEGQDAGL